MNSYKFRFLLSIHSKPLRDRSHYFEYFAFQSWGKAFIKYIWGESTLSCLQPLPKKNNMIKRTSYIFPLVPPIYYHNTIIHLSLPLSFSPFLFLFRSSIVDKTNEK